MTVRREVAAARRKNSARSPGDWLCSLRQYLSRFQDGDRREEKKGPSLQPYGEGPKDEAAGRTS
jgi:hypothetical protein